MYVKVDGAEIEYVQEYSYLCQLVSLQARQEKEVARGTEIVWKSYLLNLMKVNLAVTLHEVIHGPYK